ncbi:hypothetical protein PORCRE_839 [Porphyromonas crevioricanis JCM 15906]|uniref:Uncharacterized protein n=1 Tax=Porphyromonas crevioricanis JCM 15906 TaxID=1305617 RepID=T1DS63_9PORP|nr:hypothetical protein PORCRE_839 [Porphyromonas crevioricanis JCM 15906]GAD07092.1 hypothetical protein PORCAN_709 [Porphyromonas crevioricanis JCM 13913]
MRTPDIPEPSKIPESGKDGLRLLHNTALVALLSAFRVWADS